MRYLKIYLILGLAILLIGFNVGCDVFKIKEVIDDNGNDNGDKECEYPLEPPTGNIGDTIRSCHFEVTLDKAEYIDIEYRGPRVKVHATIKFVKAKNGKGASVFTDCFTIQDSEGNLYKWDGMGDDDQLPQVMLSEGEKISGSTVIQVGKTSSGFIAIFQESRMLQDVYQDKIKWKLGF